MNHNNKIAKQIDKKRSYQRPDPDAIEQQYKK